jgi:hypothetical protein
LGEGGVGWNGVGGQGVMEPEWWEKAKQFDQRDKGIEVGRWGKMKRKERKTGGKREKEKEKAKRSGRIVNEEKMIDWEKWRSKREEEEK